MHAAPTLELVLRVFGEPDLFVHVDAVHGRARKEEREIERVSVVGRADGRLGLAEMLEEAADRCGLEPGENERQ